MTNDADRTLADAFGSDDDDSDDENGDGMDDRQRLMRGQPESPPLEQSENDTARPGVVRQVTQFPVFQPTPGVGRTGQVYGGGQNDGVFANLSAKPTRGEDLEEKPPVRRPKSYRTI